MNLNIKGTRGHTLKLVKLGCVSDSRKVENTSFFRAEYNALNQHMMDVTLSMPSRADWIK